MGLSKNKKGFLLIILGAVLYSLRYIPFYHEKSSPNNIVVFDKEFSLVEINLVCDGYVGRYPGVFSGICHWIKELNIIIIVFAVILICHGFLKIFSKKESN